VTKAFKAVKMTTAKWTINTGEQQDLCYPVARFNEKQCLPVWGGDGLSKLPFSGLWGDTWNA
jgi:hypothetical protein